MPPIISHGAETRSRAERRRVSDRITEIERVLVEHGLVRRESAPGEAARRPRKRTLSRRPARRKANPK